MDFQLSQEMKNRIEKNDQQERLDYEVSSIITFLSDLKNTFEGNERTCKAAVARIL